MSDPYGFDKNSDPRFDPNIDDSGATALWAGIAIAALLIVGGFLYFSSSRIDNMAANAPVTTGSRSMPSGPAGTPAEKRSPGETTGAAVATERGTRYDRQRTISLTGRRRRPRRSHSPGPFCRRLR